MRNISEKLSRENQSTHLIFYNFYPQSRAVYDIMWKNMIQPGRPQKTIRRMRIACRITKIRETQYLIIFAFPLHKWLHERASLLRYTYIA